MKALFNPYPFNQDQNSYGTDRSTSIAEIKAAGFNPIGITKMACDETFIFETAEEAKQAYVVCGDEYYYYGKTEFLSYKSEYDSKLLDLGYSTQDLTKVYWLNETQHPTI